MRQYQLAISFFASVLTVLTLWSASYANDPPAFFNNLSDVPIMEGMYELDGQGLVFDKSHGRIVESVAILESLSQQDVRSYYARVLPQFGWQRIDDNAYIRDQEVLSFYFERHHGQNFIYIMAKPN